MLRNGIRVVFTFTFESMVRGYHEYQFIWGVPTVGEALNCHRELGNSHDPYAMGVKKVRLAWTDHVRQ